jgi:hypothetical protein
MVASAFKLLFFNRIKEKEKIIFLNVDEYKYFFYTLMASTACREIIMGFTKNCCDDLLHPLICP